MYKVTFEYNNKYMTLIISNCKFL